VIKNPTRDVKKSRFTLKPTRDFDAHTTPDFKSMNEIVFWNSLGFFFYGFLLRFAVYELMDASATTMGLIFSGQTFGSLLITPISSYLTDRMSKKKLVLIGSFGRGTAYFVMYIALGTSNLVTFGIAVFLLGAGVVFFWTPMNALVSQKTHKTVRSTAFGKQMGTLGKGNFAGAMFTLLYFGLLVNFTQADAWLLYLPLILFGGFNFFAGIRFNRQVDEKLNFDDFQKQNGLGKSENTESESEIGNNSEKTDSNANNSRKYYILGFIFLIVAFVVASINQTMASPFLQLYVRNNFFTTEATLQIGFIVMLVYLPSEIISQLLAPKLGDLGDRINPSISITIICGVGSLVTFLLINTNSIYMFGFILVIDTSLAWANMLVMQNLMSRISKANRGKIFGIRQWMSLLGAVIGPIIGGYLWDTVGENAPFNISIFVELSLIPLFLLAIRFITPVMEEKI